MRVILVLFFYLYSLINILALIKFFKLVDKPRFRDDRGDVTTEVGYAEDSQGNVLGTRYRHLSQEEIEDPHIAYSPNVGASGQTPF
ncbi:MAG: hypothetical protein K8F91_16180 [Candidatus Obscuribacterales bacterium]|nr:hypothetical protein [Candidatus Obscuribacterales bacterium]